MRDDIEGGLVAIPDLDELGFVFDHNNADALNVYAVIAGERNDMGSVSVFDIDDLAAALAGAMVDVLLAE